MPTKSNPGAEVPCAAPHVLVLMATRNGATWLNEQLASVFAQERVQVAVLASDHGSTDATLEVLQRWQRDGWSLWVLPGKASGKGAAANFLRLLRESSINDYDYVALADQDDIWLPGRLARAVIELHDHGAHAYSSDAMAFWPDGRKARLGKAYPQRALDYLLEPAGPGCTYVLTCTLALALQEELKRDPERFADTSYHDWLIYVYAKTHGYRWIIDSFVGVSYRQHARNDVGANLGLEGVMRRWRRSRSGLFRRQMLHMAKLWPEQHPVWLTRFERYTVFDRFVIAANCRKLRRRPKDQVALIAMMLLGVMG